MSPTVLVFGVAGFVGTHLAKEFAQAGYDVAGADRAEGLAALPEGLASYTQADVRDDERVGYLVHALKPEVIINLAAITSVSRSWEHPQETLSTNATGAINILEAAKELETSPKLLFIGSSREYQVSDAPVHEGAPLAAYSPYSISKIAQNRFAEAYAHRYGLRIYRTRSFAHTGPGQSTEFTIPNWCRQVARIDAAGGQGRVQASRLDDVRDYCDVRDVVRAYRMIVESDFSGELFNVGSGFGRRMGDILDTILCFASHSIEVETAETDPSEREKSILVSSNVKLRSLLGWKPEHDFSQTLEEVYSQFV